MSQSTETDRNSVTTSSSQDIVDHQRRALFGNSAVMLAGSAGALALLHSSPAAATNPVNPTFVSLDQYGILGGSADVTSQIQTILNNEPYVYVPKGINGSYRITGPLSLPILGQKLFGPGSGQYGPVAGTGTAAGSSGPVFNAVGVTGPVIQANGTAGSPYLCSEISGISIHCDQPTAIGININNNSNVILSKIAFYGTFLNAIKMTSVYGFHLSDISTSGTTGGNTIYDACLSIVDFNAGQIDNFYTSNLPPNASTLTAGIRARSSFGSAGVGNLVINNPIMQGPTIGLDLQQGQSFVVNGLYTENCPLAIRLGALGTVTAVKINGGLLLGAYSSHPQYSSYFTDIYIKNCLSGSFDNICHGDVTSKPSCYTVKTGRPIYIRGAYGSGAQLDFVNRNLIRRSTDADSNISLCVEGEYDGTASKNTGNYRTIKSTNEYLWRHFISEISSAGTFTNAAWTPNTISVPTLVA